MANDKKQDESGLLSKAVAMVQNAEVKAVDALGGSEAAELAAKAFQAGNTGDHLDRAKLGIKAEVKAAENMIDTVKEAAASLNHFLQDNPVAHVGTVGGVAGAVAGYEIQRVITGGESVKSHDGVPATPNIKTQDPLQK